MRTTPTDANTVARSAEKVSGAVLSDHPGEGRDRCDLDAARRARHTRGIAWVIGAFVICPCHLPITLAVAAALLGGTAAGVALRAHPLGAGSVITLTWVAATWHGFRLMRAAQR
jgi:hypothetical protein